MAAHAVDVAPRPGRGASKEPADHLRVCDAEVFSSVLSRLLGREVALGEVRDRAIALGLLRQSGPGERIQLDMQTASRLLLAGFHLPALAEWGTPERLKQQRLNRQKVLMVILGMSTYKVATSCDPCRSLWDEMEPNHLQESGTPVFDPGQISIPPRRGPLERYITSSGCTDFILFVAARSWSDLPASGSVFFGGNRWPDGMFHWDCADCDTDREGNIFRC
jgi:hypothetical protein